MVVELSSSVYYHDIIESDLGANDTQNLTCEKVQNKLHVLGISYMFNLQIC